MTYGELLKRIIDLGFEEDSITDEYGRLIRNAINQACGIIYSTVALQIEGYLRNDTSNTTNKTSFKVNFKEIDDYLAPFTVVSEDTDEDDDMNIPRILEPLVPLLTAHYVWLDDDLTKATYYYNEYDSLKNEIISVAMRPRNAVIVGGF